MSKVIMIIMFKFLKSLPLFITDKLKATLTKERLTYAKENSTITPNLTKQLICAQYCGSCPSLPSYKEGFYCATGKSDFGVEEKGCNCFDCPLIGECGPNIGYFCKHGLSPKVEESTIDSYAERFITHEQLTIDSKESDDATFSSEIVDVHLNFESADNEDKSIKTDSKTTILESSLKAGNKHIHACGGVGKCSTCRVLITDGIEKLNSRNKAEQKMADFKGFTDDVRLACQCSGNGDIKLRRLVLDDTDLENAVSSIGEVGREVEVAILFSDIRSFTSFSETSLPYDLVHILNRYFNTVGEEIDKNGGFIDKYMGDGIMAIFGLEKGQKIDPAYLALKSAFDMIDSLKGFNTYLSRNFDHKFDIGIGIHYGKVVVGNLGNHKKKSFTAIGDVVNTTSRIEALNKDNNTTILVSKTVYDRVKDSFKWDKEMEVPVKGKELPLVVFEPKPL